MTYLTTSDLLPLFQLFNNCDDKAPHRTRSTQRHNFSPAFDVCELDGRYYLDGELPGVNQDNIDIEFSDPYTLVVKGHTARNYPTTESHNEPSSRWRQPTVEDDDDDDSASKDSDSTASVSSKKSTPGASEASQFRYWASERQIGKFQRTFNFPTRVDQDGVRASLNNGILSIVVPKEATPKSKKIRIQ